MSTDRIASVIPSPSLEDAASLALSVYNSARINRPSPAGDAIRYELPDGPPGPIELDAVVAHLSRMYEEAGELMAALAVIQIEALRKGGPSRIQGAVRALATECGPRTIGFVESARAAARLVTGEPPADPAGFRSPPPAPIAKGDRVEDVRGTAGLVLEVLAVRLETDPPKAAVGAIGSEDWRWAHVDQLVRVAPIKVGDVVQRRDGAVRSVGPLMTVREVGGDWATCFGENGVHDFHVECLVRVPKPVIEPLGGAS